VRGRGRREFCLHARACLAASSIGVWGWLEGPRGLGSIALLTCTSRARTAAAPLAGRGAAESLLLLFVV
jgi:hypothetical protein